MFLLYFIVVSENMEVTFHMWTLREDHLWTQNRNTSTTGVNQGGGLAIYATDFYRLLWSDMIFRKCFFVRNSSVDDDEQTINNNKYYIWSNSKSAVGLYKQIIMTSSRVLWIYIFKQNMHIRTHTHNHTLYTYAWPFMLCMYWSWIRHYYIEEISIQDFLEILKRMLQIS